MHGTSSAPKPSRTPRASLDDKPTRDQYQPYYVYTLNTQMMNTRRSLITVCVLLPVASCAAHPLLPSRPSLPDVRPRARWRQFKSISATSASESQVSHPKYAVESFMRQVAVSAGTLSLHRLALARIKGTSNEAL